MGAFREFWNGFVASFRAARQGGEIAEADRRRTAEMGQQLHEDRVAERLHGRW